MSLDKTGSPRTLSHYTPATTLPRTKPELPSQPCAACGQDTDPLRALCALAFEDGVRVLCSEECKTSYRSGERMRRKAATATSHLSVVGSPQRAVLAPITETDRAALPEARDSLLPLPGSLDRVGTLCLWIGAATIGTAALLAGFTGPDSASAAVLLTVIGAAAGARLTWPTARDLSLLGWSLGPLGVVTAAIAAYSQSSTQDLRLDAFGGVLCAAALLGRGLLDVRARKPVAQAREQLRAALPETVQIASVASSGIETRDAIIATTETVATAKIRVGEEIVVRRGERLGVDGVVRSGEASVLPYPGAGATVRRVSGEAVLAGAIVVEGSLRVLASRVGDDRAIARVTNVGRSDERAAARFLRITQRVLPWAAALSLLGCIALCIVRHTHGEPLPLTAASAILMATPLLALRRAAQWPLQGAAAAAAERGILFQSGAVLDLAGRVSVVVMAPHRTLTEGKPELLDLLTFGQDDAHDENARELLALAAGAELSAGEHPIGRAVVRYAEKRGIVPSEMRRAKAVPGRGLTGTGPDGQDIVIGSRRLLLDEGVSVATADAYAARAEASGRTAVFMAVSGRVRAVFALQDHLRPGARAAVQRLFDLGLEVVLVTGDQRGPVEQLAAGFDIAHIKCELLPEERAHEVRSLREAGGPVAVIGFPADDAAALGVADVAIALGAAGGGNGDNAIALLGEDLRDAAAALWIARAARASMLGALRISSAAFIVLTSAAIGGLISVGLSALLALLVDAHGIQAGARLLRRVALRLGSNR